MPNCDVIVGKWGKRDICGARVTYVEVYNQLIHGVTLAPYCGQTPDIEFEIIHCLTYFILLGYLLKCPSYDKIRFHVTFVSGHFAIVHKSGVTLAPYGGARVTCLTRPVSSAHVLFRDNIL